MKIFLSFAIAASFLISCQEPIYQADVNEIIDDALALEEDSLAKEFFILEEPSSVSESSSSQSQDTSSSEETSSPEELSSETELSSVEFGTSSDETSSEEASSEETSSEEVASSAEEPSSSSEVVAVSSAVVSGCYPSDCVADQPVEWGSKTTWPVGTKCSYLGNNYTSKKTWPTIPPSAASAAGKSWHPWTDDGSC